MNILIIGGTRLTGPHIVRQLHTLGHTVAVFHRGHHEPADLPADVRHIHSDGEPSDPRDQFQLRRHAADFQRFAPDAVIHMLLRTSADAETAVDVFRGLTGRLVLPSSMDVYRTFGRIHRTEPGDPDPTPSTESSPLREKLSVQGETNDKLSVERIARSEPSLRATILRYPAVYGPGDHRLYEHTRRMFDGRPAILLDDRMTDWRWTFGHSENVAYAVTLAATDDRAAGQTYNVGEPDAPTYPERVQHLARAAGWTGRIVPLPPDQLPAHLAAPLDWRQHWTADSTRIRRELGYREVVGYEEALRRTIDWQRANPKAIDPKEFDYAAEDAVLARLGI